MSKNKTPETLPSAKAIPQIEIVQYDQRKETIKYFQNRVNKTLINLVKNGSEIVDVWSCRANGHYTIHILHKSK